MHVQDILNLLESQWDAIRQNLGEGWNEFLTEYRQIVGDLPEEPSIEELEHTADAICTLLGQRDYTRGLLQGWLGAYHERIIASARSTLSDKETARQIRNRFQQLATASQTGGAQGEAAHKEKKER